MLKDIAERDNKHCIICLEATSGNDDTACYTKANVFDLYTKKTSQLTVREGNIIESDVEYQLANLSDQNWTKGYSNTDTILLFNNQDQLLIELLSKENIICGHEIYHIENIDYDSMWIRVSVNKDASDCMYPANIKLE